MAHPAPLGYVPLIGLTQDEEDIVDAFPTPDGKLGTGLSARQVEAMVHRGWLDPETWTLTDEGEKLLRWLWARA